METENSYSDMWYALVVFLFFVFGLFIGSNSAIHQNDFEFYNVTYIYAENNKTIINYTLNNISSTQFLKNVCDLWAYNESFNRYNCGSYYVVEDWSVKK